MKLKGNTRRRRGKPASFLSALTGRWTKRQHRLPAHLTGENDWEVEVPQIQMSRAFAVMLVLFIVGVGGLFAFQMFGKEEKKQAQAAAVQGSSEPAALSVPPPEPATSARPAVVLNSQPASAPDSPTEIPLPEPAPELPAASHSAPAGPDAIEQQTYRWKAGDTMSLVAAQFNVSSSALRTANPDKPQMPGTEFIIPPPSTRRMITSTEAEAPAKTGATIFDPLADRRIAETTPPKAEVVPELPDSPAEAADTPPPAKLVEQTTSKNVATRTTPQEEKKPAATTAKTKPATTTATAKPAGQRTHVVAKGDTVFNIARRFGISAEEIAKANGLDSNFRIRPGQQLKLPVRR